MTDDYFGYWWDSPEWERLDDEDQRLAALSAARTYGGPPHEWDVDTIGKAVETSLYARLVFKARLRRLITAPLRRLTRWGH